MRSLAAAVLATLLPLLAAAQEAPAAPPAYVPPAYVPPAYVPPAPSVPAPYVPPPPGAAPAAQAAPAQPAPQAYPPPPQYAPPQYAPPPAYTPPPQSAPPPPYGSAHQRDSWYIGFGLGAGDGRVIFDDGTAHFSDMVFDDPTPMAFNFRVGATVSPQLLVGFDGGFVAAVAEDGGAESSIQLNYYDVGFMFFPQERGFFVRGALGLSSIVWEVDPGFSADARGFNVLGGLGYAFWLGQAFNLTLNVEGSRHWFSEPGLEGGTALSAWVGFDWY